MLSALSAEDKLFYAVKVLLRNAEEDSRGKPFLLPDGSHASYEELLATLQEVEELRAPRP